MAKFGKSWRQGNRAKINYAGKNIPEGLRTAWSNLEQWKKSLTMTGGGKKMKFKVPSSPNNTIIPLV